MLHATETGISAGFCLQLSQAAHQTNTYMYLWAPWHEATKEFFYLTPPPPHPSGWDGGLLQGHLQQFAILLRILSWVLIMIHKDISQ